MILYAYLKDKTIIEIDNAKIIYEPNQRLLFKLGQREPYSIYTNHPEIYSLTFSLHPEDILVKRLQNLDEILTVGEIEFRIDSIDHYLEEFKASIVKFTASGYRIPTPLLTVATVAIPDKSIDSYDDNDYDDIDYYDETTSAD